MLKVDQHPHRLWTLQQGLAICLRHSWVGLSLLDTGMLGLVKIVGRSRKTFSSKSEMVRQVTTKLSSRLSFFSKVVEEIVVFVPFVPSCLIKASRMLRNYHCLKKCI